jgi:predicted outer membrane repeat protein
MSQRSIRRAQLRQAASQQRRAALRLSRAALAAGAAAGATALFAPGAQAATLTVTTTSDAGDGVCDATCTLRDAVGVSNANDEHDSITFASGVSGTIHLGAGGQLHIGAGPEFDGDYRTLTIEGPGADVLTLSGDGAARIAYASERHSHLTLSGLTLEDGSAASGGAVWARNRGKLTIADSVIADSAASQDGGAIYTAASLQLTRSRLTGNDAAGDGGALATGTGVHNFTPYIAIEESTISGNTADGDGGAIYTDGRTTIEGSEISGNSTAADGGGIFTSRTLRVEASTISGNTASADGGGIARARGKYSPLDVIDSEIAGNAATHGGGISFNRGSAADYGARNVIAGSTISGNDASVSGAGVYVGTLERSGHLTITHSTLSGNDAGSAGGAMTIRGPIAGELDVFDTTISGNSAAVGAGANVLDDATFDNSTIAANAASTSGGGVHAAARVGLNSTIVADNAQGDLGNDAGGGFDLTFALVEQPGGAALTQSSNALSIIGQDPQLGPLADNGGPTRTHLPARTSPAIERGHGELGATDQRGLPRIVDNESPNAVNGDGTDIGAVELDKPPPGPMPPADPPPGDPPPGDPPPGDPPPAQDLPPQAVIKHNGLRAKRDAKRFASGTARDDRAVAAVDVAIVRKRGGRCRQLLPSGRFSRSERCSGPIVFQPAAGTTRWRFALKERLDRGYYVLYSRAVDDSGRKQISFGPKSRRPFRVR